MGEIALVAIAAVFFTCLSRAFGFFLLLLGRVFFRPFCLLPPFPPPDFIFFDGKSRGNCAAKRGTGKGTGEGNGDKTECETVDCSFWMWWQG